MLVAHPVKGETPKAFRAYKIWIELGDKRSATAVASRSRCGRRNIDKWARRWNWQERLAQAIADDAEREAEAAQRAQRDIAKKREALRLEHERKMSEHCEKAHKLIADMLAMPIMQKRSEDVETDAKGNVIARTMIFEPVNFNMGQAARLLEIVDRTMRLTLGMPTGRSEFTGRDGEPLKLPSAPNVTNIIVQRDEHSDKASKIYHDFFRQHPDHPQAQRYIREFDELVDNNGNGKGKRK
jgi:hypothetical protein